MSLVLETTTEKPRNYGVDRAWKARLALAYCRKPQKTVLSTMRFEGPLRVQRPFYPEGERCHTYLLHPPGGMVSGDQIDIDVHVNPDANATITTPSAGKIYAADSANVVQRQNIRLAVGEGATLEFLPQENILFNTANAELSTEIELAEESRLIAWDLVSFGRPHGGFLFESGSLKQSLKISIGGELQLHEGFKTDPTLRILQSPVGLMGFKHMASMFIAAPERQEQYPQWIETIRGAIGDSNSATQLIGVTRQRKLILVRALAEDIESLRNIFINIWQTIRPEVMDAEPITPRIWLT